MKWRQRGFTLLEVMVALAIFSISAMIILQHTSRSASQQSHLEEKTFALWLAENHLASLRLQSEWPTTGNTEIVVSSAKREWRIEQTVEATSNPLLRKLTVNVSRENQQNPLISLTGFAGEH